jgi:electron transfer flavoprotein alpha subunit
MTVYCLVELDGAGVADAALRALTFARGLADGQASQAGARLAAVVFGEPPEADLARYGVTDVIAMTGIDGYAPQAWARALAALLDAPVSAGPASDGPESGGPVSGGPVSGGPVSGGPVSGGPVSGGPVSGGPEPGNTSAGGPAPDRVPDGRVAVLAAATDRGNEVLAHLGAITGLPMAANCVAVSPAAGGGYALVRQRWAGLLLEEALLDSPVALLTVATDAVSAQTPDTPPAVSAEMSAAVAPTPAAWESAPARPESAREAPVVRRASASVSAADLVVRAVETPSGAGGASLATARVVVGGGRGVGSADGFAPLEELAALLGGVVGVSRVVTSEGWRPHSMQVGQTGTKITPDLYLACGISGAIQHIAGCSGAKYLIAINKDPSAPMMTRADYAVIGDLHEIIPALVQAIKDRTERD